MAEFQVLKPDNLMKMVGIKKTLGDLFKIESYEINVSNLQNSGVTSDSILINISQYLLIIIIAFAAFMIMLFLLIVPCLREKVNKLIKSIMLALKFRTVITYITGIFLDLSFSFVT